MFKKGRKEMKKNSIMLFLAFFGTVFLSSFCSEPSAPKSLTTQAGDQRIRLSEASSIITEVGSIQPMPDESDNLTDERGSRDFTQVFSENNLGPADLDDDEDTQSTGISSLSDSPLAQKAASRSVSRRNSTGIDYHSASSRPDNAASKRHSIDSIKPSNSLSLIPNGIGPDAPDSPDFNTPVSQHKTLSKKFDFTDEALQPHSNDNTARNSSLSIMNDNQENSLARDMAVTKVLAQTTGTQNSLDEIKEPKNIRVTTVKSFETPQDNAIRDAKPLTPTKTKKPSPKGKASVTTRGAIDEIDANLTDQTKHYYSPTDLAKAEQTSSGFWSCFKCCRKKC
jgi:hypothetical protein